MLETNLTRVLILVSILSGVRLVAAGNTTEIKAKANNGTVAVTRRESTCQCGVNKYNNEEVSSKIIGGTLTRESEYPWRVALFLNTTEGLYFICAGTLIQKNIVLTASHCVRERGSFKITESYLHVAVGYTNISGLTMDDMIPVQRIKQHENYNWLIQGNDIALLFLTRDVTLSDNVGLACLPYKYKEHDFVGATAIATGWGTTSLSEENNTQSPATVYLNVVNLPVVTTKECQQKYYNFFNIFSLVNDRNICTYKPGYDTCKGDSGGSIDIRDKEDRKIYSIGIVSWGFGCAQKNGPGVYTKITKFLTWIEQQSNGTTFCGQSS